MKKKLLSLVLAVSMLLSFMPVIASAYDGTKYGDYLYYEKNSDNTAVTITDCKETVTEVIIPSEIDGLPVTKIGYAVFKDCSKLTSVIIPDGVTEIERGAFWWCDSLTSVTIPDSVTKIGMWAFFNCSSLTSVTIPDGVTKIEHQLFEECSSLTSVRIPDSVTEIDCNVFYGCDALEDVYYNASKSEWDKIEIALGNSWLTNATIYYNANTQIPITEADVTMTETETAWSFEVETEEVYDGSYVYVAVYDENGTLVDLNRVVLEDGKKTKVDIDKTDEDSLAKVLVWVNTLQPTTNVKEFKLTKGE